MNKKTIRDISVTGKKVIIRVDFNVPLDDSQNITDDTRIKESLPSINYILEKGGSVILMSHLGRPKGVTEKLRLSAVAKRLSELTGKRVNYLKDCIGSEVESAAKSLKVGEIMMLENLRFYKEEEGNDEAFAKKLASLADIYVNDAFGTAHRAHASTATIAKFLPSVAGFLIEKELNFLGDKIQKPERPFIAILGGSKISTKIGVIHSLLQKVDVLIIGGGMTYTFNKSIGLEIGQSIFESDKVNLALDILNEAKNKNVEMILPVDNVVAYNFMEDKENAKSQVVLRNEFPVKAEGVDIGPKTIEIFTEKIKSAKTIFWNGPMGIFEIDKFAHGTSSIAKAVAGYNATSVVGGGDSIAAIAKAGVTSKITHISTGGGASLEFIEGKELPGIACLQDK